MQYISLYIQQRAAKLIQAAWRKYSQAKEAKKQSLEVKNDISAY